MQTLILAAGRGSRLGQKTSDVPKCLLEVGRKPLIEHQLGILADAGAGTVGMVLGYCADEIQESVGIGAEYIINPRWKVTNSLYSFWLARDWVTGPLVVLNCDTLFHPEILDRLLASKTDAIAYDSSSGDGREHMKVNVHEGRLISMNKEMDPSDVAGENVGILSFTAETAQCLFEEAGKIVAEGGENLWLGSAVCRIAATRNIHAIDIKGLPWGEVDSSYDLDRVRKEVWPAIERSTNKRRPVLLMGMRIGIVAIVLLTLLAAFWMGVRSEAHAWEILDFKHAHRVELVADNRSQVWSLVNDDYATMQVIGPASIQIDSRLILPDDALPESYYVLEVQLDGVRLDWFKEKAIPSKTWHYEKWTVGKRRRTRINIPAGRHEISVGLVAAESDRCLIRVRHRVLDDSNEE